MTFKISGVQALPIHRATVLGTERPHVLLTVHCPIDDRAVPARRCEVCPRCATFPRNPAAARATIACRVDALPRRTRGDLTEQAARTRVHEVMESVYAVTAKASLGQITALFESHSVTMVPVTSDDGVPIGVISRADLVRERWELTRPDLEACDVMTPLAYTLPDVANLTQVIALMALEGVHAVPIVDVDGVVVGIVTAVGTMRWMAEHMGYLIPASGTRHDARNGE
jgi:CBS domain-containing protein